MGHHQHKKEAPVSLRIGILSLSSTRILAEDVSGHWIREEAEKKGSLVVCHTVVDDNSDMIKTKLLEVLKQDCPEVMILTGGTGISRKDVTIEAVKPLFSKELSAFGTLFTMLSHQEIGASAILSRSTAGIIEKTAVFCIPGSLAACRLACTELIFPEMGHIIKHINQE